MEKQGRFFSRRQTEPAPEGGWGCLHPVVSYKGLPLYASRHIRLSPLKNKGA